MSARPRWLYAHRGASAEVPENTIEAFRRAIELGADAIETDVHLTRDGHVVCHHDPTGERTSGVAAALRDVTLDEVSRWDAGFGFAAVDGSRPHADRGFRVPTLAAALAALPDTPFNVDLKARQRLLVEQVVDLVRRLDAVHRVLLTSKRRRTIGAIGRAGHKGPIGLAASDVLRILALPTALARRLPPIGVAAQVPRRMAGLRLDTPGFIAKCHALGLRVDYWTINRPADARVLLDKGADGIMTDDPAALAPLFGRGLPDRTPAQGE